MGANELQQSLLDAMDLLSNKAANSTNAAVTIKGEIVEELDSGLHQYSISYGGAIYKDAYAVANMTYLPSTVVYLLVPDGNFDNPKIILNAASPSASVYADDSETESYISISDNLFGEDYSVDLKSWLDQNYDNIEIGNNFGMLFKDYISNYKNFVFSAYIKTEIDSDHQSGGNYGLELYLPFLQPNTSNDSETDPIWKTYIMDVSTMQGNPYGFNEYQKVNLYFDIDDSLTYDTSRTPYIVPFTKDFGYTDTEKEKYISKDADIHIKTISFNIIDILKEEDATGYYLSVVSDSGNYFLSGKYTNSKKLSPVLKVSGKTTNYSSYDCYWFIEDSSINTTSEDYSTLGGLGWKCINKKTNVTYDSEGRKTFSYITNNYSITVKPEDVISTLRYKCVLVKDDIVVGGSIKLKNLNVNIKTSLVSKTGSNVYSENIGNVSLIARVEYPGMSKEITLSTEWQRFDKDGNYLDSDFFNIEQYNEFINNGYQTEITFPASKIEKLNTINCTFYQSYVKDGTVVKESISTETIVITTSANLTYTITIINGDKLYKYDADGDSPMIADYDGPLSSAIKSCDPLGYRVFKVDGTELTETEYKYCSYRWAFPKNSMMKLELTSSQLEELEQDNDYYYITGRGNTNDIEYKIIDTYNKKKSNNTIYLTVSIGKDTLTVFTSIKFVKDGESGTNGGKYTGLITYKGYAYGERDENKKIRKMQVVYDPTNKWRLYDVESNSLKPFSGVTFDVEVYRDGQKLVATSDLDTYSVAWSMFDSYTTNPCFTISTSGVLTTNPSRYWTDSESIYCNIVQVEIKVGNKSDTNSDEYIYAYYPIEITRMENASMADNIIPNLDGGYDTVIYASDGTNPQYDNTNEFVCVDGVKATSTEQLWYIWSCSKNLHGKTGSETSKEHSSSIKITPNTKYDNGITQNYVKVELTLDNEKRQEINDKIAKSQQEEQTISEEISKDEDIKQYIVDFSKKISYNNYKSSLDSCSTFLKYRFQLLVLNDQLTNLLEEIRNYCVRTKIINAYFHYQEYYTDYLPLLQTAYSNVYLLGYNKDFYYLEYLNLDMEKAPVSTMHADIPKENLGPYYVVNDMADVWNDYATQYNNIVMSIWNYAKRDAEFKTLYDLEYSLLDLPDDYDLGKLQDIQDFINLKKTLSTLANKINILDGQLISYDAFNTLVKEIDNKVSIYRTNDYSAIYTKKISDLDSKKKEQEEYQSRLESYLLNGSRLIHIKPIVMILNRYELSNINGWDGSKLYIDEKNNEYLLAPQVGAGIKNRYYNTFTGIVMGVKKFNKTSNQQIGLFGYNEGIQSMFLNAEDGSAIFGNPGVGQITIDPTEKALLYSYNFWESYKNDGKPSNYSESNQRKEGMLIDLSTPEIRFGSGNFVVTKEGHLTAKGGGSIAGWQIGETTLESPGYKNGKNGICLDSANDAIILGSTNGKIYSGKRTKLNETVKGFYLSDSGLSINSTNGSKFILDTSDTNGNVIIYSGNHNELGQMNQGFYLSNEGLSIYNTFKASTADGGKLEIGRLSGKHWTISGNNQNSYIGYNANALNTTFTEYFDNKYKIYRTKVEITTGSSNQIYLGTDGFRLGNKFVIDDKGNVAAKNLIASDSGEIGGFIIGKNSLTGIGDRLKVIIHTNGNIETQFVTGALTIGEPWHLRSDGSFQCSVPKSYLGHLNIIEENGKFKTTLGGITVKSDNTTKYNSSDAEPFEGNCESHIKSLARTVINTELGKGGSIYNGINARISASISSSESGTIGAALNNKANKGAAVTGSITDSAGKSCSFSLTVT